MKVTSERPLSVRYTPKGTVVSTSRSLQSQAPAIATDMAASSTSILGIPDTELTTQVRSAIMTLMAEVDRLRQELEQSRRRIDALQSEADLDGLLAILNRRAFVRELSRMMAFTERYGVPVCLLYLDLNGFKCINDEQGHAAGDAALQHVAQVLRSQIRDSDVVGRLGGDEFGILLTKADQSAGLQKADALNAALAAQPFGWKGQMFLLSVSYGAYQLAPGLSAADALSAADMAMYSAKRARAVAR